jgi:hypothetical protein
MSLKNQAYSNFFLKQSLKHRLAAEVASARAAFVRRVVDLAEMAGLLERRRH